MKNFIFFTFYFLLSTFFYSHAAAPVLDKIGDKTATEGQSQPLVFTINANDSDGDSLTYSTSMLPQGASFDANTQTFSWQPAQGVAQTYIVTFFITDGTDLVKEMIKIIVNESTTRPKYYVRENAIGNGSGADWINAYTDLPAVLERGATYYVADGNYCPNGYRFNDPIDGGKSIKILKATTEVHGTDVGWDNIYGDGQAVFTERMDIRTSYIVFDGVVGNNNSLLPNASSYGFRVIEDGVTGRAHYLILAPQSAAVNYVQISHCALVNSGEAFDADINGEGRYAQYGIYIGLDYANNHYLISDNYMSNGSHGLLLFQSNSSIVENNIFTDNWGSHHVHQEVIAAIGWNSDDVIIRNNVFYHPSNMVIGVLGGAGVANDNERWQVYNNIVIGDGSILSRGFGSADSARIDYLWSCEFHHNVFYNIDFSRPAFFIGQITDIVNNKNYSYNNIFYKVKDSDLEQECTSGLPGSLVHGYNAYYDCTGRMQPGSTDEVYTGIDPFEDSANLNFKLKAHTQPGKVLQTPYNIDYAGSIRTNWDKGAYEYIPTGNTPPVINPINNQTVFEGELIEFDITAFDADGDPVTITPTDHYIWQTDFQDAGNYTVTFIANDGKKDSVPVSVSIDIINVNTDLNLEDKNWEK